MTAERPRRRRDRFVSASELAELGYCERKLAFDAEHGDATTPEQRSARERGTRAHAAFYDEGIAAASVRKGRCFIATLALGEGPETHALRAFRDLVLRRSAIGRRFIGAYYRAAPALCRWLEGRPVWLGVVRVCARLAARAARIAVDKRRRMAGGEDR